MGYSFEEKDIKAVPGQIVQLPQTKKHDFQINVVTSVQNQEFVLPYFKEHGQFELSITAKASIITIKLGPSWVDCAPPAFSMNGDKQIGKNDSFVIVGRVIQQPNSQENKIYIIDAYDIYPTRGASNAAPPQ